MAYVYHLHLKIPMSSHFPNDLACQAMPLLVLDKCVHYIKANMIRISVANVQFS